MPQSPARTICLVTTGHLSTNPRLVKEAEALAEAGYSVRVIATRFLEWADSTDRQLDDRPWKTVTVPFGPLATRPRRIAQSVRRRLAGLVMDAAPRSTWLANRSIHYVVPELTRRAVAAQADLYIAHNLAALPAASMAADARNVPLGFDAEDFHRGELPDDSENSRALRTVRLLEETYIPRCQYVTAASGGIAEAYQKALGIDRPTVILNVFPLSDRNVPVPVAELAREKPKGSRSLHWFSQTIGAGRGLEDAVRALPELPGDVVLTLRGAWAAGYERELRGLAESLGVGRRVLALPPCPPAEIVRRTEEHDVGLALEVSETVNRDLCVTNKLFTYMLAGRPVLATATTGQAQVCSDLPEATHMYLSGEVASFANGARSLLASPTARRAALEAASHRYNWDHEKATFLDVVRNVL